MKNKNKFEVSSILALFVALTSFSACKSSETIVANELPQPPVKIENHILAQYKFAGDFKDSSINQNDATPMNGALLEGDGTKNWVKLDGIDDYVEIPGSQSLLFQQGTISFWAAIRQIWNPDR